MPYYAFWNINLLNNIGQLSLYIYEIQYEGKRHFVCILKKLIIENEHN